MMAAKVYYHIVQKVPFRVFYHYCNETGKKARREARRKAVMLAAVMFVGMLFGVLLQIAFVEIFCLVMGTMYLIFNNVFWYAACRRRYKANKMLSEGEQKLNFYADSFTVKWDREKGEYPYHKLKHIKEADDAFYLMVNDNAGQIVVKKQCPEDLITFLRTKVR